VRCSTHQETPYTSSEIDNTSLRVTNLLLSLLLINDSSAAHVVSHDILLPAITDVSRRGVASQPFDVSNRTFYRELLATNACTRVA
jgi:hypothetical protein